MTVHGPSYIYCDDPEICCGHSGPVVIVCKADGEEWPCETKRSHHTPAYAARIRRWADNRIGRPAGREWGHSCHEGPMTLRRARELRRLGGHILYRDPPSTEWLEAYDR